MPARPQTLGEHIAELALSVVGHPYLYGGAPGPNFDQPWDCSSCVNSVVGHYAGQSIPGYPNGTYNGKAHGPNTTIWLAAQGGIVGSIPRAAVEAGDLMCWQTHIGIAIDNAKMVSAEDPANGTRVGTIDGFMPGETLTPLRLAVIGKGGISFPPITFTGQLGIELDTRQMAKDLRSKVWARQRLQNVGRNGIRV